MSRGICRYRPMTAAMVAVVAAVALSACGSSGSGSSSGGGSGSARSLLAQTFSSGHSVKSGVLSFALTLTPSGSSTLTTPIQFSISGPFQSRGKGQLPKSDLTIGVSALGRHGSLSVISTGTAGYVGLDGADYQLPAADFQKLESSFATTGTTGSQDAGLSELGINPLHWLTNPSVVGTSTVGGASTTHIRAGVNVSALLADVNTFLAKTASKSTSSTIPTQIPPATAQRISSEVKNATVDIWTGKSDTTLRKLALNVDVPVTGQIATELGGMKSAGIGLTVGYSDLNQSQSIATPSSVQPYADFETKLQSIGQSLAGALSSSGALQGATGSGSSSSGSTGSSGNSGSASSSTAKYTQCIEQANGDVTKMQKCASLLNSGG